MVVIIYKRCDVDMVLHLSKLKDVETRQNISTLTIAQNVTMQDV